nr:MAG TPA: hypothetical protein [Caudoviricetes sp.]
MMQKYLSKRGKRALTPSAAPITGRGEKENDRKEPLRPFGAVLKNSDSGQSHVPDPVPPVEEVRGSGTQRTSSAAAQGSTQAESTPAYDPAVDYSALMTQAAQAGNLPLAAEYERLRNAKIDAEGLPYEKTAQYTPYAGFSGEYDAQLAELSEQLANRPAFAYDLNADALYQQYADAYTQQGQLAMRDTMGQAAALTGGYGSSYAQAVGQQTYDAYLQQLSAVIPTLYGQAADRYDAQTDALYRQYSLLDGQREAEYARYRDTLDDAAAQRAADYKNLVALISATGYRPTDAELAAAGLSRAQASAYQQAYPANTAKSSGGKGGSGRTDQTDASDKDESNTDNRSLYEKVKQELAHIAATKGFRAAAEALVSYKPQLSKKHYEELMNRYGNYKGPIDQPILHLKPPLPYMPNTPAPY